MSEQPFNPWNQKMPWTDDSDASSGDDKENIHKKEAIQADEIVRAWIRHTNIKWAKEKEKREKAA